jgi:membrane protease YdiL (CAAX protease family)
VRALLFPCFVRNSVVALCVTSDVDNSSSTIRPAVWVGAYFALWTAVFLLLRNFYEFGTSEALAALVILGLIFPALSLLVTRRVLTLPHVVLRPGLESAALVAYLAVIALVLVSGFEGVARITTEPLHSVVLLGLKLTTFVILPAAMLLALGRYRIRELIPISLDWAALSPAFWMSLAGLLMQSFLGRGLRDIHEAHLPAWVIVVAAPLTFGWLLVEAGVVEEFFFRALLQDRLEAVLRSSWGGLVVAALLFGLVHAPGLYMRTTATLEPIGTHPALLLAVGYSMVVTSLAGLFLGVLWMRTKNFAVVVIVHAAVDLLPTLAPWIRAFHLAR